MVVVSTPTMNYHTSLSPATVLGELSLYDHQISPSTRGSVVAEQFKQCPDLPGVLVIHHSQVVGVVSRTRFHARLSQPYGLELFLKRPIEVFLDIYSKEKSPLQLSYLETVDEAVRKGLNRVNEEAFEPIVVVFEEPQISPFQSFFLLDFHTLLLAQSQILISINLEIQQQQQRLESEQQKVQDYTHLLEKQQELIQDRNQLLETQHQQLVQQSHEIELLNQRFVQIGQVLSVEGKKAFQATFAGVNAICHSTNQIVDIGQLLSGELDTLQKASQLIKEVSQQVRHLSVQAAIVANHAGSELSGFSHITAEIGKLVNRTLEAGRQMHLVADRFRDRLEQLTESAHDGTKVARSLIQEIEQAAIALNDLETLVQTQTSLNEPGSAFMEDRSGRLHSFITDLDPEVEGTRLLQKLSMAEATLSDLREMIKSKNTEPLVQKIRQTLDHHKKYVAQ